jgi:lipopolysaccharide/colanic/teichoic acid biosynthesis glycosyltransferase
MFDLGAIILTLPLWLPVMLLVMLAVRLSSEGPIFFKQRRIGYRGRTFMIYKFRSMRVNAETRSHESHFERLMREGIPMAKLDAAGDPRIIPWGHFLRATGLDELPQLFNVLRGEMSLIGPRPCTAHEFEHFTPYERQRADAVPGLTGYWQVNGKNQTTFDQMIALDIYYAQNLSLSLDLAILARTIPTLIREAKRIRTSPRVRRESESCGLGARQEVNPG